MHDADHDKHQHQPQVHVKKSPQIRFGVHESVAEKNQRHVVEVKLHAKNAVENAAGSRVEHLQHAEPHEDQQGHKERRTEGLQLGVSVFAAIRSEERQIDNGEKKVLGEVNRHIVREEFA